MSARPTATWPWLRGLAIAAALLAPFLIYFGTARSIVSIWNSSDTFAHGYIILPISLWLIWSRRSSFAQLYPAPFWPGLLLLLGCGFGWLLAELGDVRSSANMPLSRWFRCRLSQCWAGALHGPWPFRWHF